MTALILLQHVNRVLGILFMVCYFYQFLYIPVALAIQRKKNPPAKKLHRYAVLISARNEEAVIGQLLDSIARQDYPADLVTTFVVADNCTDSTAQVARNAGAVVFERFNKLRVGKGYALDFLLDQIKEQYGAEWL